MLSETLPPQLKNLYLSFGLLDTDIAIEDLYRALFGDPGEKPRSIQQQYVGSRITKLNRRIASHKVRVVPGDRKGTYRLTQI